MTEYKLDYVARPQFYDFHIRKQHWAVNVCHRRAGKAVDTATPIPMADGSFKLMGSAILLSCSVTKYWTGAIVSAPAKKLELPAFQELCGRYPSRVWVERQSETAAFERKPAGRYRGEYQVSIDQDR